MFHLPIPGDYVEKLPKLSFNVFLDMKVFDFDFLFVLFFHPLNQTEYYDCEFYLQTRESCKVDFARYG